MKINAVIIGYGNIGRCVHEAILASDDFVLTGIVDPNPPKDANLDIKFAKNIDEFKNVDVAIIGAPSRFVPDITKGLLEKGINCVDAYDIHTGIYAYKTEMDSIAKNNKATSIIAAGWDPGTDSIIRGLLLAMAPKGLTYTDFGPGLSMGHSVAVKSIEGVKDAVAMTMPKGDGIHRRMIYIELEKDADFDAVTKAIKLDSYFSNDECYIEEVSSVDKVRDMGHGVKISRKGVSSNTHNQLFSFNMKVNNPALTAQVLISAARATTRTSSGCYTLLEIPIIDMLDGDLETLIHDLV